MKKIVLCFFITCCSFTCFAQNQSFDKGLLFLDTIEIYDPILIRFDEHKGTDSNKVQLVLVSKSSLDSLKLDMSYQNFLLSMGYLFFPSNRFSCILNNYLHNSRKLKNATLYDQLVDKLREAEKDIVWVNFDKEKDKPKSYKGWKYHEIYPRKFLVFLVKGSHLRNCQSIDEITIKGMDNIYFPILVPITW